MNIINPNLPQIQQQTIQKDNVQNKPETQSTGGQTFLSAMKDTAYTFFKPVVESDKSNLINFKKTEEVSSKKKKLKKDVFDLITEIENIERRMERKKENEQEQEDNK